MELIRIYSVGGGGGGGRRCLRKHPQGEETEIPTRSLTAAAAAQ